MIKVNGKLVKIIKVDLHDKHCKYMCNTFMYNELANIPKKNITITVDDSEELERIIICLTKIKSELLNRPMQTNNNFSNFEREENKNV